MQWGACNTANKARFGIKRLWCNEGLRNVQVGFVLWRPHWSNGSGVIINRITCCARLPVVCELFAPRLHCMARSLVIVCLTDVPIEELVVKGAKIPFFLVSGTFSYSVNCVLFFFSGKDNCSVRWMLPSAMLHSIVLSMHLDITQCRESACAI